jgi:anthranilate synthase component 1
MASDEVAIFDNLSGTLMLVVHVDAKQADGLEQANARLDELQRKLDKPAPQLTGASDPGEQLSEDDFTSSFGEQAFLESVDKIKDYIMAGDAMQVVPSQRLSAPFTASPLNLYRSLRRLNPSPYMFFLNLDDFHIVGSSPEVLARLEDGQVTVRPIAGTRRRGKSTEEDIALEQDMLNDPKEIAEHLMLIDLGRNDVGRISKSGSVEVTEKMVVERYSHVMHITSNVVGDVTDNMGPIEVLKATLPAGTLSGAPKIRAMEIIDEVEPVKRGIYGGAVGYIGWNGNMDTAIAIRTAVIKDQILHVQAGAGVVADSKPELEWKETMNKARAVMRAAAMVSAEVKK